MTHRAPDTLVQFSLDGSDYALRLDQVDRVVPSVYITSLPGAPKSVAGVINLHGEPIPVYDLRKKFDLPGKPLTPEDQFLITKSASRTAVLIIDSVEAIIESPDEDRFETTGTDIEAIIRTPQGLTLIYDIDRFLTSEEEEKLTLVLNEYDHG